MAANIDIFRELKRPQIWQNIEWVKQKGLRSQNVEDYFRSSIFHKQGSNNEIYRGSLLQSVHLNKPSLSFIDNLPSQAAQVWL